MTYARTSAAFLSTLALVAFAFAPTPIRGWILAAALVAVLLSLIQTDSAVTPWCLLVGAVLAIKALLPVWDVWPIHLGVPVLLVACYSKLTPGPGPMASWAARGSFAPGIKVLVAVVVVLSSAVFLLWVGVSDPQIDIPVEIRRRSVLSLILAGVAFAALNAILEEVVFRGIALGALSAVFAARWPPVLLQAAAFGALHYSLPSIPSGIPGVVLTSAYGAALGVIAQLAEGIGASCLAHFLADVLVFSVMIGWL